MDALKWFGLVFLGLFFIWIVTGGPERASSNDPFIHQPNPVGEGGTYSRSVFPRLNFIPSLINLDTSERVNDVIDDVNDSSGEIQEALEEADNSNSSIYKGVATLERDRATRDEADDEYVTIKISSNIKSSINIDGWRLRSGITGNSVELGEASYLPRLGGNNKEFPIRVQPGDELVVTTGHSPIGVSFRINLCTGYLEQFQDFKPSLPRKCPLAEDEIGPEHEFGSGPNAFNSECIEIIEDIGLCKINTKELPITLQPQCRDFIVKDVNYNSCVDRHKNGESFYGDEWRLYLRHDRELWRDKREVIELIDIEGKVIDVITY